MKNEKNNKSFMDCFYDFISDSENLTLKEVRVELEEEGIDTDQLKVRVSEIVKVGLEKRRMGWLDKARERRLEIEKILEAKKISNGAKDLKTKIMDIMKSSFGPAAQSYAEVYFRKLESISEEDLESFVEDLENLDLLVDIKEEKE